MKKLLVSCLMCCFFALISINVGVVFAFQDEQINFVYNNKIFTYTLSSNIKYSSQFDINYELNKYKRFSSAEDRKILLKHLLSIGIDKDIAINYLFPNLCNTIKVIEKNLYVKSKNAELKLNPNTENVFSISKEVIGKNIDKNFLYNEICSKYLTSQPLDINILIIEKTPNITSEMLKKHTYLRSDFSTSIASSNSDRKHNIKNALTSINKTEVMPNDIFSFNKIVGKRTLSNGYRNAKIIVNNEFVDGVGGGVCQVSSTLYNSALLAGLEIVEANKHSKQVSYVKQGFDAMVNFGSSDLKFKNNTNEKITIITNFTSAKIRIRIFGQSLNNVSYKLSNEIIDVVEAGEDILEDKNLQYTDKVTYNDEFFYLKAGNKGMTIKSYREKYVNGELTSKELLRKDKFNVQNAVKVYGIKTRELQTTPFDSLDKSNLNNQLKTCQYKPQ